MEDKHLYTVDVIVPTYKPGHRFLRLLKMLQKQDYAVHKIIIMNTTESFWNASAYKEFQNLEVHHLSKKDFDHGATRHKAALYSEADIIVFMTDDSVPYDEHLITLLVASFNLQGPQGESIALAYARQLPSTECRTAERYIRQFNYPETAAIKTKQDISHMGIKAYFASNVCCAYRKSTYLKLGGFIQKTIFNEDMIFASLAINSGYAIFYCADAKVIHSHNYTNLQQFHRNFDLAVSQAEHPEVFANIKSEGEGIKMVRWLIAKLMKQYKFYLVPQVIISSGFKYIGYYMGKHYKVLPSSMIRWCSMNQEYWN